jgi:hypothetical protein
VATDPNDRVDRGPLGSEIEDPLEEPPGVPGPGRSLRKWHALGHLDDSERGQLAGPRLEQIRPEPDELLGGRGVRDGDEDPPRQRRPARHAGASAAVLVAACQRSTR